MYVRGARAAWDLKAVYSVRGSPGFPLTLGRNRIDLSLPKKDTFLVFPKMKNRTGRKHHFRQQRGLEPWQKSLCECVCVSLSTETRLRLHRHGSHFRAGATCLWARKKSFRCSFPVVFLCVALVPRASEVLSSDKLYFKVVSSRSTWFIYLTVGYTICFDIIFAFWVYYPFMHCIC